MVCTVFHRAYDRYRTVYGKWLSNFHNSCEYAKLPFAKDNAGTRVSSIASMSALHTES